MDHVGVVKRAFHITRRYRALWLFGALLALFSGGGSGGNNGTNVTVPGGPWGQGPGWMTRGWQASPGDVGSLVGIAILCCCLLLILVVAGIVVSYVARTALYRMVDTIEETGDSPSWREGFRLGWSHRALRLFGIDLAMGIPFALAVILVLLLALTPLLLLMARNEALTILGIVMTVALGLLTVLAIILAGIGYSLLRDLVHRQATLEDRTVGESIVRGYQMLRDNLRDAALMWLLMFGVGLAWGIVMIPVFLLVLALAGVIGALPAYLIWRATNLVWLTLLVGIPLFLLIMVPPLVFLNSLYIVFKSSTWTLTFREFRARAAVSSFAAAETGEGES